MNVHYLKRVKRPISGTAVQGEERGWQGVLDEGLGPQARAAPWDASLPRPLDLPALPIANALRICLPFARRPVGDP